jgi:hypothetical protein
VRGLVVFAICFVLTGVAIHALLWVLLRGLLAHDRVADAPPSALASLSQPPSDAPPLQPSGPRHDSLPAQDLKTMRERENAVFEHLGWRVENGSVNAEMPGDLIAAVAAREAALRPPTTEPALGAETQPASQPAEGKGATP